MTTHPFVGELVRLRGPRVDDRQHMVRLDAQVAASSTGNAAEAAPVPEITASEWERRLAEDDGRWRFVIEALDDDRFVGICNLKDHHPTNRRAAIGIRLLEEEWGRGFGTDAVRLLLRFAFDDLDLHKVALDVVADNDRAIAAYERCGFRVDARRRQARFRDGRAKDVLDMSILDREWRSAAEGDT